MTTGMGFGLVLPMFEEPIDGVAPRWADIQALAVRAEELNFDTVWTADEVVWRFPGWGGPRGWWECLTMTGAVAAGTTTIGVGTWVISALHRNPGMIARAAETLDEISSGRFVLGVGAGHHGGGAGELGYPADRTVSRYAESLEILVPMLRGESVTFDGAYHRAAGAELLPHGPRHGNVPLMLGGHSPRTMRLAAENADIWSAFATTSSHAPAFEPLTEQLDEICESIGRDPSTIERSVGVFVEPGDQRVTESLGFGDSISGSTDQIVDALAAFGSAGVTRLELVAYPNTIETLDRLEPVLSQLIPRSSESTSG